MFLNEKPVNVPNGTRRDCAALRAAQLTYLRKRSLCRPAGTNTGLQNIQHYVACAQKWGVIVAPTSVHKKKVINKIVIWYQLFNITNKQLFTNNKIINYKNKKKKNYTNRVGPVLRILIPEREREPEPGLGLPRKVKCLIRGIKADPGPPRRWRLIGG